MPWLAPGRAPESGDSPLRAAASHVELCPGKLMSEPVEEGTKKSSQTFEIPAALSQQL